MMGLRKLGGHDTKAASAVPQVSRKILPEPGQPVSAWPQPMERAWGNQEVLRRREASMGGVSFSNLGFLSDEESPVDPGADLVGVDDAGAPDAAAADAGPVEAGTANAKASDGGAPDAGVPDASVRDAGAPAADAGPVPADGGAPAGPGPAVPGVGPGVVPAVVPAAPVIESKATVHAPDGTPDSRKTIGVVETIEFTVGGGLVANWSANNGFPAVATAKPVYQWAAPEKAGTSTITATVVATGQTATLDMTVIAPADIKMKKHDEIAFPAGSAGAGMHLVVHVVPKSVNFGWISLLEVPGPASAVTGFFLAKQTAGTDLSHHPNVNFVRFSFNNTIQFDTAAASGPPVSPPPVWANGSFFWNIPNRYRASNSTGTGDIFTHTKQTFAINAAGRVTVGKQTESVGRTP